MARKLPIQYPGAIYPTRRFNARLMTISLTPLWGKGEAIMREVHALGWLLVLALVAGCDFSGCGRRPDPGADTPPPTALATRVAQQAAETNVSSTSDTIVLREDPADEVDEVFYASQLQLNTRVSKAANAARSSASPAQITEADRRAIRTLVMEIKGFSASPFGGRIKRLKHFSVALVPGKLAERNYNVYLIKVPGSEWMILTETEMPGHAPF